MGHFSVVFVKTKIFYGPFNFCMGHLHRITKLYVSNGPWPLPFPITDYSPPLENWISNGNTDINQNNKNKLTNLKH
jgi:hypothetical protein